MPIKYESFSDFLDSVHSLPVTYCPSADKGVEIAITAKTKNSVMPVHLRCFTSNPPSMTNDPICAYDKA